MRYLEADGKILGLTFVKVRHGSEPEWLDISVRCEHLGGNCRTQPKNSIDDGTMKFTAIHAQENGAD
jgi:hypothetical protein